MLLFSFCIEDDIGERFVDDYLEQLDWQQFIANLENGLYLLDEWQSTQEKLLALRPRENSLNLTLDEYPQLWILIKNLITLQKQGIELNDVLTTTSDKLAQVFEKLSQLFDFQEDAYETESFDSLELQLFSAETPTRSASPYMELLVSSQLKHITLWNEGVVRAALSRNVDVRHQNPDGTQASFSHLAEHPAWKNFMLLFSFCIDDNVGECPIDEYVEQLNWSAILPEWERGLHLLAAWERKQEDLQALRSEEKFCDSVLDEPLYNALDIEEMVEVQTRGIHLDGALALISNELSELFENLSPLFKLQDSKDAGTTQSPDDSSDDEDEDDGFDTPDKNDGPSGSDDSNDASHSDSTTDANEHSDNAQSLPAHAYAGAQRSLENFTIAVTTQLDARALPRGGDNVPADTEGAPEMGMVPPAGWEPSHALSTSSVLLTGSMSPQHHHLAAKEYLVALPPIDWLSPLIA